MAAGDIKEVLFNDGEGVVYGDFNDLQRFMRSRLVDYQLAYQQRLHDAGLTAFANPSHLFCIGNSAAPYAHATNNRQIRNEAGPIFQVVGGELLVYNVTADEVNTAVGTLSLSAANPRWVLVSVELAYADGDSQSRDFKDATTGVVTTSSVNKQRRVTATWTVTQGAENASPVEPATPSGDVKYCAIKIGTATTLLDPTTELRDYRMPIGNVETLDVRANNFCIERAASGTADFAQSTAGGLLVGGAVSGEQWFAYCPMSGGLKRVSRISLAFDASTLGTPSVVLIRQALQFNAGTATLEDITTPLITGGAGTQRYNTYDVLATFPGPLWSNGYPCGYAVEKLGHSTTLGPTGIGLRYTADATQVITFGGCRFVLIG